MRKLCRTLLCAALMLAPAGCTQQRAAAQGEASAEGPAEGADISGDAGLTRNQKIAAGTAVGVVGIGVLGYLALSAVAASMLLAGKGS